MTTNRSFPPVHSIWFIRITFVLGLLLHGCSIPEKDQQITIQGAASQKFSSKAYADIKAQAVDTCIKDSGLNRVDCTFYERIKQASNDVGDYMGRSERLSSRSYGKHKSYNQRDKTNQTEHLESHELIRKRIQTCKKSHENEIQLSSCLNEITRDLEDRLDRHFFRVMELIVGIDENPTSHQDMSIKAFVEERLAWENHTEMKCDLETHDSRFGTAYPALQEECLLMETLHRVKTIQGG